MPRLAVILIPLLVSTVHAVAQGAPDMRQAETAGDMAIVWEVRNRFRLFREERDFVLHVEAMTKGSILAAEEELALQSDGRGWARNTVRRLCIGATGRVSEPCSRDGVRESYLTPADHAVAVRLTGLVPVGAVCAWTFDDGEEVRQATRDCAAPVDIRARYGRATHASVEVTSAEVRSGMSKIPLYHSVVKPCQEKVSRSFGALLRL